MHLRQCAFTIAELLVTLAIVATMTVVAVPVLAGITTRNRMATDLNRLTGSLHAARREAITTGLGTVVCPGDPSTGCRDDGRWERGWLAFQDPERRRNCVDADRDERCDTGAGRIVQVAGAIADAALTLRASGNPSDYVRYRPTGLASGYAGTFTLCDTTDNAPSRGITLSMVGRIRKRPPGTLSCD